MTENNIPQSVTSTQVVSTPAPKPLDTYSYKGWMNSDKFWKRALGVYGYYFVGAMMIMVPLLLVMLVCISIFGAILFGAIMHANPGQPQFGNPSALPMGKLNINMVCEDSLQYADGVNDATSAATYVQDCKDGKHPEAIERYIKGLNLRDNAAI